MAELKLIVCLDDRCGVLFNNRRVSSDREVMKHIQEITAGRLLMCSGYSAGLFPKGSVCISDNLPENLSDMTYYFLEGQDPTAVADRVKELVVYRWNRIYPSDYRFPTELFDTRLRMVSQGEFPGNSHDRITWEVYRP